MRAHEFITEKWTKKYKKSINCSNPRGFSQKAHCDGRKKNEGVAESKLIESAVFLNPTTVIVGQAHGQPLELSPNTLKQIQAIAAKHGAYYEGNGTDRAYTKGQIDRYVGSWDDEVAKTASPNDHKWLYVLFANVDANNRVQRVGVDPKDTIFNRLLATAKDNSFQGIGYTSQALRKFLQMSSEGKYDFVKMSQQPATQENLTRFLKAGEALMWPNNWEQYPNKAGKIAKAATVDVRDQYLATRKAGVYVTGSGHLKAVQNITGKQGVAEGNLNEFAPGAGDEGGEDPYKYPKPERYRRSADYFGKFEADHFDREDFDDDTGVFKGYWGRTQIAYFKFDNPQKTGGDDPGMGWYYEPAPDGSSDNSTAVPSVNNADERKQQELNMIRAFLKSGNRPNPDSQIGRLMKKHGVAEGLDEDLRKWFKDKWVRFGPDGKIRGDCARGSEKEGKPKCLPQSKAHSLGKKGRAKAAARKRREDPNANRSGKAINVRTK